MNEPKIEVSLTFPLSLIKNINKINEMLSIITSFPNFNSIEHYHYIR